MVGVAKPRAAVGVLLIGFLAQTPLPGCAAGPRDGVRVPAGAATDERSWEELLEPTPDLLVVIRPQAVRRDRVYGPLVDRAISLARARNPLVAVSGAYEAMDDADEVVIAARNLDEERLAELAIVVRGVRASVDPGRLVDERGSALWVPGPSAPRADVRELVRAAGPAGRAEEEVSGEIPDASLFELPGRTWVFATGLARTRAREALAGPWRAPSLDRGDPDLGGDAPVAVRISGRALVQHIRAFRAPGLLAPLGRGLRSVTVTPSPGDSATVQAIFAYDDGRAVAQAGATAKDAAVALSAANSTDFAWLGASSVRTSACCVIVTTPLPARLVGGLLH